MILSFSTLQITRQREKIAEEERLQNDPAYGEAKKAYEAEQRRLKEEKEKSELEAIE